jgi:hypothetical protein
LVAALLLVVNPLYRLHARRAVADVPCEALVLSTLAVALWFWQRTLSGRIRPWSWIGAVLGAGVLAGMAILAKLNGGLALMTIGSWAVLALMLPRVPAGRKLSVLGSVLVICALALATFVLLNPTSTARPVGPIPEDPAGIAHEGIGGRLAAILRHRVKLSDLQRGVHADYALVGPWEKLKAVAVQGLGRFGPFGPWRSHPPVRYDWVQDRGALVWGPWVLIGAVWAGFRGRRQLREGAPPTAWAILLQAVLALVTVTIYIPLAWDRYYLPIESGLTLLAAGAAVASCDRLVLALHRGLARRSEP